MNVFKLDDFMMFMIDQCQLCEKKKTRVQRWKKLFDGWLCIECWLQVINDSLNDKPYKIDKNGFEYVEYQHQMGDQQVIKTNIAVIELNRKLKQINSILEGKF